MKQLRIAIGRPRVEPWDHWDIGTFFLSLAAQLSQFGPVKFMDMKACGFPIDIARSKLCTDALAREADFLLMVDDDMTPDCHLGVYDWAKPFMPTSMQYMMDHSDCALVGAPAIVPAMGYRANAFFPSESANRIVLSNRAFSAERRGIEPVFSIGSGMILIQVECLKKMQQPWFIFIGDDETNTQIVQGEDVRFGLAAREVGYYVACNWDAWAGHNKLVCYGKPGFDHIQKHRDLIDGTSEEAGVREKAIPVHANCEPVTIPIRPELATDSGNRTSDR